MSTSEPPEYPEEWTPGDTGAVPVGPEPEPTGVAGSGDGAGGWGGEPRIEPFAIAALVWAIVSIVIPLIGTIVAFVLAARAADLIRRSRGEKSGTQYVTAARIVAGAVIAIWAIGLIAFVALRDDSSNNNVAVPTQPPSTSLAPPTSTSTSVPATTTTLPPATTTSHPPVTITVVPPPPTAPPTVAPTIPPTTPTTTPPTTAPPTTAPPTTAPPPTTSPDDVKAAAVQAALLARPQLGPSNRGVSDDERFVVSYVQGQDLLVTWAINNGSKGEPPTGTPDCAGPPAPPSSTTPDASTTTTTSSTTTSTIPSTTTTAAPGAGRTTQEEARYEARQILLSIKPKLASLHLDVPGVQLVGTYPIDADGDSDVVQVLYSKATVQSGFSDYRKAFDVPPADTVQCLNSAFDLP